jgi:hypothetical protein
MYPQVHAKRRRETMAENNRRPEDENSPRFVDHAVNFLKPRSKFGPLFGVTQTDINRAAARLDAAAARDSAAE